MEREVIAENGKYKLKIGSFGTSSCPYKQSIVCPLTKTKI